METGSLPQPTNPGPSYFERYAPVRSVLDNVPTVSATVCRNDAYTVAAMLNSLIDTPSFASMQPTLRRVVQALRTADHITIGDFIP